MKLPIKFMTELPKRINIQQLFPNASKDFIARNSPQTAVVESDIGTPSLGEKKAERPNSSRFLVRVTSFRKRLLDEDNLCEKYHVDLCRYAGIISCDSPDKVKIEVGQKKIGSKEVEKTLVEVWEL
jgi:hypothetical protein